MRLLFLELAVFFGNFDLDIAKFAEGKDEVVVGGIVVIVARKAPEVAIDDFNLVGQCKVVGGEGDVVGRSRSLNDMLQADKVVLTNLGQRDVDACALLGTVGHEIIDIRPFTYEVIGLLLVDTGNEHHARQEELTDHTLGAVGVAVKFLTTGHIATATLMTESVLDILAALDSIFLMGQHGHKPDIRFLRVESDVIILRVGYGRATRFVHHI